MSKQKNFSTRHMDSHIWNFIPFRHGDVVVASYAKSGTTWLQQLVAQLLLGPDPHISISQISPWLKSRSESTAQKLKLLYEQRQRRIIKTHLPFNYIKYSEKVKYVYVARDARDVAWSLHNHHVMANEEWYRRLNNRSNRLGPKFRKPVGDPREYFFTWLMEDGKPFWPYAENITSWWQKKSCQNVRIIHYRNLLERIEDEVRALSNFLNMRIKKERLNQIIEYSSFEYMQEHAHLAAPYGGASWIGGARTFFHKGTDGRWEKHLSRKDCVTYREIMIKNLGAQCAEWIIR